MDFDDDFEVEDELDPYYYIQDLGWEDTSAFSDKYGRIDLYDSTDDAILEADDLQLMEEAEYLAVGSLSVYTVAEAEYIRDCEDEDMYCNTIDQPDLRDGKDTTVALWQSVLPHNAPREAKPVSHEPQRGAHRVIGWHTPPEKGKGPPNWTSDWLDRLEALERDYPSLEG